MGYGIMQETLDNRTHGFVLELQGVLVGATQAPHVLQVGGGDWQRVVDLPGDQHPPPLGLLLPLDPCHRRPELRRCSGLRHFSLKTC